MKSFAVIVGVLMLSAGCPSSQPAPETTESSSDSGNPFEGKLVNDVPVQPGPSCGMRPDDWCAAPAGDPCGKYMNEAECRGNDLCVGMPYRGESVVPCAPDGKGFWTNCPSVGCVARALEK